MKKDIAALKHEKTKNDEDYVRYGRNQDDFREVIIEKKSSLAAEKERLADFELQLKTRAGYNEVFSCG